MRALIAARAATIPMPNQNEVVRSVLCAIWSWPPSTVRNVEENVIAELKRYLLSVGFISLYVSTKSLMGKAL